jgi:hypothetical protein
VLSALGLHNCQEMPQVEAVGIVSQHRPAQTSGLIKLAVSVCGEGLLEHIGWGERMSHSRRAQRSGSEISEISLLRRPQDKANFGTGDMGIFDGAAGCRLLPQSWAVD